MQTDQKIEAANRVNFVPGRLAGAIMSAAVAIVAIFPLAAWAETAEWHHAVQHVLIFSAGLGSATFMLARRNGKGVK